MNKHIKYLVKDTWIAIPALILSFWLAIVLTGNLVKYFLYPFFGDWAILISLPICWPYIYSPIFDEILSFFFRNDT
jgi:hypothetical protein